MSDRLTTMRVLYIYCHPLPESFHAAIRAKALDALAAAGHQVDLLDLYAEHFDPVLSEEGRRHYHDISRNRIGLETYVARLTSAEALVLQFPTWCFGLPAMLKGFFDRMIMPGVAFDLSDPSHVKPTLRNSNATCVGSPAARRAPTIMRSITSTLPRRRSAWRSWTTLIAPCAGCNGA
jgi:NAD(P)H dehydrogenase (quinone)